MATKRSDRTDTPHAVTKVGGSGPDWMTEVDEAESSLDTMQEYRVLGRLKVIQGMTDRALKESCGGEGTAIMVPSIAIVAAKETPFTVVPVFGFTEFCEWSDLKDEGSNAILSRTFDKAGDLAARARDPERRFEGYGEANAEGKLPYQKRFVEHLCFASMIYDKESELYGTPIVLSFQRGEFNQGKNLISAMMMRKANGAPVPMWGQVWQFKTAYRDRGADRKWWGMDFSIPEVSYIQGDEVQSFRALYQELKDDFIKNKLQVDRSESDDEKNEDQSTVDDPTVDM